MATLEDVKEDIGQLRLEHGNKLTQLERGNRATSA